MSYTDATLYNVSLSSGTYKFQLEIPISLFGISDRIYICTTTDGAITVNTSGAEIYDTSIRLKLPSPTLSNDGSTLEQNYMAGESGGGNGSY